MDKNKKGKKGRAEKYSDSEEDADVNEDVKSEPSKKGKGKPVNISETAAMENSSSDDEAKASKKADKKFKKDTKRKGKPKAEEEEEEEEDGFEVIKSPPAASGSKPKGSLFAMLDIEGSDSNQSADSDDEKPTKADAAKAKKASASNAKKPNSDNDDDGSPERNDSAAAKPAKPIAKKSGKKKQLAATVKKPEEEDIDAILAELAIDGGKPAQATSKKDKRDGKKAAKNDTAEVDDVSVDRNAASTQISREKVSLELKPNMTQEEIARAMEEMYGDSDEDDKKKKKKKAAKKADKKAAAEEPGGAEDEEGEGEEGSDGEGGSTVKTAAQKKKDKKERQKLEKLKSKGQEKSRPDREETPPIVTATTSAETGVSAVSVVSTASSVAEPDVPVAATATDSTESAVAMETGPTEDGVTASAADKPAEEATTEEGKGKKLKKERERGKKKSEKEPEEKTEKKPSKMVKEMQERLKLIKEAEERAKREEEEKIQREEEAERLREEKERLEKERKEREKQKKKDKIERLKAEGKYLTEKQKESRRRAQQMIDAMRAQGLELPQPGIAAAEPAERPAKKVVYDSRPKKKGKGPAHVGGSQDSGYVGSQESGYLGGSQESAESTEKPGDAVVEMEVADDRTPSPYTAGEPTAEPADGLKEAVEGKEEEEEDVRDAWDESSEEEGSQEQEQEPPQEVVKPAAEPKSESPAASTSSKPTTAGKQAASAGKPSAEPDKKLTAIVEKKTTPMDNKKPVSSALVVKNEKVEESESESESEDDSDSSDSESEGGSSCEELMSVKEKTREKTLAAIQKRKEAAEAARSVDNLRAPVVCVLGHVDTGKTKILDKLRRTNVQDGEAGGITQQIGATNVPQDTIREQTKMCKEFLKKELKLPGLLIIDTPGHESFSNLRSRGSSLCDIAILVVDIMHGLEPQTIESINLLKSRKTPFVVALNKIDRLFQWQTNPHSDVVNTIKKQKPNTKLEFDERAQAAIVQLAEQGLNAALFYENKNTREYVSVVPTSAVSGDGMGNLIAIICDLTQTLLTKQLMYSDELKATVMEVKALPGLGTTIDVILVNGALHEGDTIIVAGQEGPIVTQVRALLMPQPLRELRVKSTYEHHKVVRAAQGCKIVAKDLERSLAGLPLLTAKTPDEVEYYKEEVTEMLKEVLGAVKVSERGVFVQASTLGSLEALLEFLKTQQIPYAGINIGPVHKRDIMKASVMLEHDPQYATILAFDIKIERDAQEMADGLGVKIFSADIIYHLFDKFMAYRDEYKKKKQDEFRAVAVYPCKLKIMSQHIFNSRDPIVLGVSVEAGFLKEGTMLCVPSKEFVDIGRVSSIEVNHKQVDKATKGQEVCIKIDPIPGEAPKMYGRHFDATDLLISKISRASIDAVKNWFRDDMSKADWQLMVELKKLFEIL